MNTSGDHQRARCDDAGEPFRRMVECAPDAFVATDEQGQIVLVNRQAELLFGYDREELLGRAIEILLPEEQRERHTAQRCDYAAAPHPRLMGEVLGIRGRRKDGSLFPADVALSPVGGNDRLLICAAIRDVTERQQAQAQIAASLRLQSATAQVLRLSLEPISLQELLQRVLDLLLSMPWLSLQAKGGIFLAEGDQRLVLKAHRGFPENLLTECAVVPIGRYLCGTAAQTRQIVFVDGIDACHQTTCDGILPQGHYCVPIRSGRQLYGAINLYVDAGCRWKLEEEAFLVAIADVLAGAIRRKLFEDALQRSEERFDLALRGTDAGIWDWDLRAKTVYFSPRWKSMLGHADEEIADSYEEWESRIHPDDLDRALTTLQTYLNLQSPDYELEHRLRHKDGTYRWILARGAAVYDAEGKPCRMVGSHIDITERKHAERRTRENEVQLLAAQRILARLLPSGAPRIPGFDIAAASLPAEYASGDTFDFLALCDGSLGVVVGDVSGHGFAPALLVASTHAYLRLLSRTTSDPGDILTAANAILAEETDDDRFVTLFLGRLDPAERSFTWCNAGHPDGFVLDALGNQKHQLTGASLPLGIDPNALYGADGRVTLDPGDLLLLLTDGVLETQAPGGEFFGMERALDAARADQQLPAAAIVDAVVRAVREFGQRDTPADDLTVMAIKTLARVPEPTDPAR
jgi:PAS domain S-box-containing protein